MLFKDLLTEKDGVSFCPVRAGFIMGFVLIVGLTIQDIASGQHFFEHAADWIKALGEYLGFGGAAVGYKNTTEKE